MNDHQWKPIKSAPYGRIILVRNSVMREPLRATRGYAEEGVVHPDSSFCTSVYTSKTSDGLPFPSGRLICAEEWCEEEKGAR